MERYYHGAVYIREDIIMCYDPLVLTFDSLSFISFVGKRFRVAARDQEATVTHQMAIKNVILVVLFAVIPGSSLTIDGFLLLFKFVFLIVVLLGVQAEESLRRSSYSDQRWLARSR